jgi:hypothetical protein
MNNSGKTTKIAIQIIAGAANRRLAADFASSSSHLLIGS